MNAHSLLQRFAIDNEGRVRSVDEVRRGLGCNCHCPVCSAPVMARQGSQRQWHFAHATGADCHSAGESALHLAAKQVIRDTGGVLLPGSEITETVRLDDGREGTGQHILAPAWIDFASVAEEVSVGSYRIDLVGEADGLKVGIEIAVTHFVDDDKESALREMALPTMEIVLDASCDTLWDWPALEHAVLHQPANRHWLQLPDEEALREKARSFALEVASRKLVPTASEPPARGQAVRTRFRVDGYDVVVTEYDFGIAVWNVFNHQLIAKLRPHYRRLGGQWKPKYHNWLLPVSTKDALFELLQQLGERR